MYEERSSWERIGGVSNKGAIGVVLRRGTDPVDVFEGGLKRRGSGGGSGGAGGGACFGAGGGT